jgi:hypothetical protein
VDQYKRMKRLIAAAIALTIASSVLAQSGTFTIRRPVDGSSVREVVKVRIPEGSIPDTGYIGIFVNGKFLEAIRPTEVEDDYVYELDTKAKGIADGEATIEAVLFIQTDTGPVAMDRSSVMVTVDNHTSIPVPEEGIELRYTFYPGEVLNYLSTERVSISTVSQALAQIGGRGSQQSLDIQSNRLMYAHDNAYETETGPEGLIRIQALPDKGKDYAIVNVLGETEPRKFMDYEMHPWYMRITDVGREVFSAAPSYHPSLDTAAGDSFRTDLFVMSPLPVLPTRAVRPGDAWEGSFLASVIGLDEKDEKEKHTKAIPARGSFEGVEWQDGIPCAKIRTLVRVGEESLDDVSTLGTLEGSPTKLEMEELTWFSLDSGVLVKKQTNLLIEILIESGATVTTGAAGGGPAGGRGDNSGAGNLGLGAGAPGGAAGGAGAPGRRRTGFVNQINSAIQKGTALHFRQGGRAGGPPGLGGPPSGLGGGGAGFQGGRTGSIGGSGPKQVLRISVQSTLELEQD